MEKIRQHFFQNPPLPFAGTAQKGNDVVTSGGRVLAVTGLGNTIAEAIKLAYSAVKQIKFDGMQYRTDIGGKAIISRQSSAISRQTED